MNLRLLGIGMLAAVAGVLGALAFVPGAVDSMFPKRGNVTVGKALIGGPFELTTHNGKRVRDAAYRGKLMLVFFGFTYCPDICPAGLQVISAALDEVGSESHNVASLFVTIDPERDTPEQLKSYVSSFHPTITGLTGSTQDISAAAKAYRVYYRKVEDPALSDYTMDHTSFIYLMDAQGNFITHFAHVVTPDKLAARLKAELKKL